ncbi:MAG TPA: alginate export family protein [Pirellulaceae bacterium]|nr:alginate export family protein [Pirellulaceae bacterium]
MFMTAMVHCQTSQHGFDNWVSPASSARVPHQWFDDDSIRPGATNFDEQANQAGATAEQSLTSLAPRTEASSSSSEEKQEPPRRIDAFWKDLPVRQTPGKTGNIGVPPSGPGYYSFRDVWSETCRDAPPPFPYPPFGLMAPSYFDVNWSFLDDPTKSWGWSDILKRQPVGCDWLVTSGGSLWWRHMAESNARLTGVDQNYDLVRTRLYADVSYRDFARFYFEFIDAHRFGGDLPPLPIDVNRTDILNAFVDLQFLEIDGQKWWTRLGRQELNMGSQRLVSTLDWANTRRTFQGVRLFNRSKEQDIDLWWTQPVIVDPSSFDDVDGNQHFVGAWMTRRPDENHTIDYYYLFLKNSDPRPEFTVPVPTFNVHTFGVRNLGSHGPWHHDYEFMFQLGNRGDQDIVAGAVTAGHGYHFEKTTWNPMLWIYYDWASGDRDPTAGNYHTFNPLFPFGHYYNGFADIVGRQNLHDVNLHLFLYPRNWITFNTQYHFLTLANAADALYNPAGIPVRRDLTGAAGRTVGHELDLLWNFHVSAHTDVLVGYSRLFAGRFLRETGPGADPDLFYVQLGYRW